MTVEVAAGTEDCFFVEDVKKDQTIDFEYQVGIHKMKLINLLLQKIYQYFFIFHIFL